jgi:hypothetical protein
MTEESENAHNTLSGSRKENRRENLARLSFFRESIVKPIEGRSPDLLYSVRLPKDFTSVAPCTEL